MESRRRGFLNGFIVLLLCSLYSFYSFICLPHCLYACVFVFTMYVRLYAVSVNCPCSCVSTFRRMEIMTSSWDFGIRPALPRSSPVPPPCIFLSACIPLSLGLFSLSQIPTETHTCPLVIWEEQPFHSDSHKDRERELCEKKKSPKSCFREIVITT